MAWILLIGVAVPLALQTSGALRSGGFIRQDLESARAKQLLSTEIGVPEAAVALVLHSDTLRAGDQAFETAALQAVAGIASAPHVRGIVSHAFATTQVSAQVWPGASVVVGRLPRPG